MALNESNLKSHHRYSFSNSEAIIYFLFLVFKTGNYLILFSKATVYSKIRSRTSMLFHQWPKNACTFLTLHTDISEIIYYLVSKSNITCGCRKYSLNNCRGSNCRKKPTVAPDHTYWFLSKLKHGVAL